MSIDAWVEYAVQNITRKPPRESTKSLKERVYRGANLFRKIDPFWFKKINTGILDIESSTGCLEAQMFGHAGRGARVLIEEHGITLHDFNSVSAQHGLCRSFHHDEEDLLKINHLWVKTVEKIKADHEKEETKSN